MGKDEGMLSVGQDVVTLDNDLLVSPGKRGRIVRVADSEYPYLVCINRLWLNFKKDEVVTAKKLSFVKKLTWQCRGCHERCKLLKKESL